MMTSRILGVVLACLLLTTAVGSGLSMAAESQPAWTYEDGYYSSHEYYDQDQYSRTTQAAFNAVPNDSHVPDNTEATFHSYTLPGEQIDEPFYVHYFSYYTTLPTADCDVPNVNGAGIDRGNNRTGLTTDDSLVNAYNDWRFHANDSPESRELYGEDKTREGSPPMHPRGERVAPDEWDLREVLTVVFAEEGAFAQDPVRVNPEDEVIFGLEDCNDFPPNEGWYRSWFFINGTGIESDEKVEFFAFSNWVYICSDCQTRSEAVEKLGPPPGTGTADEETPETPVPTGTATLAPQDTPTVSAPDAGPDDQPQSDDVDETTPSPTKKPAATSGNNGLDTPTAGSGDGFGVGLTLLSAIGAVLLSRYRSN